MKNEILSKNELLEYWQAQRRLTRKVIEVFPEKDLFEFSIGGMRPFSQMCAEFIAIATPSLKSIVMNKSMKFDEKPTFKTREELLKRWDEDTLAINELFVQIPESDFQKEFVLFGEYNFQIKQHIFYFIDNEIHHRGQAYVYLRALDIQPPFFWETL